jgi:hypothetical protein
MDLGWDRLSVWVWSPAMTTKISLSRNSLFQHISTILSLLPCKLFLPYLPCIDGAHYLISSCTLEALKGQGPSLPLACWLCLATSLQVAKNCHRLYEFIP